MGTKKMQQVLARPGVLERSARAVWLACLLNAVTLQFFQQFKAWLETKLLTGCHSTLCIDCGAA